MADKMNFIPNCRQARGWVVLKAQKVIALNNPNELNKKFISNRIKYPQHDLKQDEAIRQLMLAVDDGLLRLNEQVFEFGTQCFSNSDHDWYCYACHESGNVSKCERCWRVYHQKCVNFTTNHCNACELKRAPLGPLRGNVTPSIEEISTQLRLVFTKLNEETKHVSSLTLFNESKYHSIPVEEVRKLVYNWRIDFNVIEQKIKNHEYTTFDQFLVDVQDVGHNMQVINGPKSRITSFVRKMLELCTSEMQFLKDCMSCFGHFYNRTGEKAFFFVPCKPPHPIVFARFKGFPYWPGKVIGQDENGTQIWFFGGNYTRCCVPKKAVFSIEEATQKLRTENIVNKGPKLFQRAITEYDQYIEAVGQPNDKLYISMKPATLNGEVIKLDGEDNYEDAPAVFSSSMADTSSNLMSLNSNGISNGTPAKAVNGITSTRSRDAALNGSTTKFNGQAALSNSNSSFNFANNHSNLNNSIADSTSNMSFTFNGDSMQSFTNSDDNHSNLTKPENLLSPKASVKKSAKKRERGKWEQINDAEALREENMKLRKRLRDTEERLTELQRDPRNGYTREYVLKMQQEHRQAIHDIKQKIWCRVCGEEAFYYCCLQTSYCTPECQMKHWWSEHKGSCLRKKVKKRSV